MEKRQGEFPLLNIYHRSLGWMPLSEAMIRDRTLMEVDTK